MSCLLVFNVGKNKQCSENSNLALQKCLVFLVVIVFYRKIPKNKLSKIVPDRKTYIHDSIGIFISKFGSKDQSISKEILLGLGFLPWPLKWVK